MARRPAKPPKGIVSQIKGLQVGPVKPKPGSRLKPDKRGRPK